MNTSSSDVARIGAAPLSLDAALARVALANCGAIVTFCGVVRDHSEGREGVTSLEYEAYPEEAERVCREVIDEARARWPDLGRIVIDHRTGVLELGETAVVVAVSAPHRGAAFEAARYCIDEVKRRAPIWKRETWRGGSDWSRCAEALEGAPALGEGVVR